jgi:excisionase family DNA binding protein
MDLHTLNTIPDDRLLTPEEVAALFSVDPKTVSRWATAGKLEHTRTLGGHRRFPARAVRAALERAHHPQTA